MRGKGVLIAVYGPDGVGKHKQGDLLENNLMGVGISAKRLRYPVYDVQPTGPRLDNILHKHREKLPEEEMQALFAQNRADFEPTLKSWLDSGAVVIAENYKGTGLVWGVVRGLDEGKMVELNKHFVEPDVAIVLDGPRWEDRPDHPYGEEDEWYKVRQMYLTMADKYGWVKVDANASILTVASRIWAVVKPVVVMR